MKQLNAKINKSISSRNYQKQSPKGVLLKRCSNFFTKFTGKHQCWSLFFNKVAVQRPATLLEKTPAQVFFQQITKFWTTTSVSQVFKKKKCFEKFLKIFRKAVLVESFSVTMDRFVKLFCVIDKIFFVLRRDLKKSFFSFTHLMLLSMKAMIFPNKFYMRTLSLFMSPSLCVILSVRFKGKPN